MKNKRSIHSALSHGLHETDRKITKLLERWPAKIDGNAAFDALHFHLDHAKEVFLGHGDGGREGVFQAIGHLIEYLSEQGIPLATLAPIEAVMVAIAETENGRTSPIFAADKLPGAPPKPHMDLQFEGTLAVVTECCVLHCRREGKRPFVPEAAQMAASMINRSAWPTKVTADQLIAIRERVQGRKGPSRADRQIYDELISSDLAKAKPYEFAKILLLKQAIASPEQNS